MNWPTVLSKWQRRLVDSIRHPARHQAMAEQGSAVVRERYDWDGLAAKLERVWESCLVGSSDSSWRLSGV